MRERGGSGRQPLILARISLEDRQGRRHVGLTSTDEAFTRHEPIQFVEIRGAYGESAYELVGRSEVRSPPPGEPPHVFLTYMTAEKVAEGKESRRVEIAEKVDTRDWLAIPKEDG